MNPRTLLAPLTPLYRAALAVRERRLASGNEPIRRLRYPVISIGNLSTGGSGKTPFAIALARALQTRGFSVDVLSRGYGRHSREPARVHPEGPAAAFGDEPLLIARSANVPVFVAPQRFEAGLLAEASGPSSRRTVHILDDGFQHRQLHRDIDIVLTSSHDFHDRLLPAGNLREPLQAIQRATAIAIPSGDTEAEQYWTRHAGHNSDQPRFAGPVWRLRRRMDVPPIDGAVIAFCGIARPRQFFDGLTAAGLHLAATHAFPDHHHYTGKDLDSLVRQARKTGATALITTEKDEVRLGNLRPAIPLRTARLRIEIENEPAALDWLISRLA